MNRETTDKRIVYARNTESGKALFGNLRPLNMYALLQNYTECGCVRSSVVKK